MSATPHIVVAAGGTGGHMVPAHVLVETLRLRGWTATLITDERGLKYPGLFEGCDRHVIPAASIGGRNPLAWAKAAATILKGRAAARRLYRGRRPSLVAGFGGYPAFPALLGALADGIPTLIHDQNAVLGRVNRLLAGRVDAIATAYPDVQRLDPKHAAKATLVGNPVREDIVALGGQPYPPTDGVLQLLVVGGSQGATALSRVVPLAVEGLSDEVRARLSITQQCRPEDVETVAAAYRRLGIPARTAAFIGDMAAEIGKAHLVIARSGASTVSELAVAGRPAIFVPLPTSMDNHQVFNTAEMTKAGGACMIHQSDFTPERLAPKLEGLFTKPETLATAAAAARSVGRPDAGARLADLVERLAGRAADASKAAANSIPLGVLA
ncbi:MAG: undecaprenyldiphospho-muramoylpentapeptide beta-N-acetylglucosaminyltransferase [Alphaproteobacteria bacterium]|nr:undecaprenyldiphospho-muramoylpentapeptide beta-N-acetylglucosaminyltransferase [Alphaproteobacteria bacterium]